jgi:hypothetical protein
LIEQRVGAVFKGREVAEIELPRKAIVPRREQELPPDPERDVMVAAAVQLEQHRRQRDDLRQQIIALEDEMREKLRSVADDGAGDGAASVLT